MYTLIISGMMFVSLLLIVAVLLQTGKSEGASSPLSSSGRNQLVGVSQAKNILEQTTWALFLVLVIAAIGASLLLRKEQSNTYESLNLEIASQKQKSNNCSTSNNLQSTENES